MKLNVEDYKTTKINSWTILDFSHCDSKQQQYWKVQCDCGYIGARRASHIKRGLSKCCFGCRMQAARGPLSPHWKGATMLSGTYLTQYKWAAFSRNLCFDLTLGDIENLWKEQNGLCAYSGLPLREGYPSIDRIDNGRGYYLGNIHLVLKDVNMMKHTLTETRFLELCKAIAGHGGSCGI